MELGSALRILAAGVGGGPKVARRHQVRERVVVYERGVLVRTGDAVDAEAALGVVVTERPPEPCGLDEQVETLAALEVGVLRRGDVAANRVSDYRVDVERRRAGGPVSRALLAPDRAPRERRAGQTQLAGARLRATEDGVAPAKGIPRGLGRHVRQDAERIGVHVPERVAVVAAAGEPLGGDPPPLGAGSGLYDLEEREAHRLLKLGIAVELDVCAVPDVVEIRALRGQQAVPPDTFRRRQRGVDQVAQ